MREQRRWQLHLLLLPVCPKSLALLFHLTTRADTVTAGSSLGANKAMFDLSGTKQGKDPFKLGKQVSRRHAPRDQKQNKKKKSHTMAVQTAAMFLPTSMNHFPLSVSIKIQAC